MIKRGIDILLALAGLLLLAPLFAVIALAVVCSGRGPVFFRQERVGRDGRLFSIYKFRSMVIDAEKTGASVTAAGDRRITPIGRLLRRYKLDELPQLINVVRGEMSLVGPRPEVPKYVAYYTMEQKGVLSVRPGITDPASLVFIDEERVLAAAADPEHFYRTVVMQRKLALNLDYIRGASVLSDLIVLMRTVLHLARAAFGRFVSPNSDHLDRNR